MFEKFLSMIPNKKMRDVATMASGMLALLLGRKLMAIGLFTKGALGVEDEWKKAHPDYQGGLDERWRRAIRFYDATHMDPMNRKLHMVGIPLIATGALGLFIFRPLRPAWIVSATSFTVGWGLNFIGHGVFEKNAPAFADDPLSFLAGPIWDVQQIFTKKEKVAPEWANGANGAVSSGASVS